MVLTASFEWRKKLTIKEGFPPTDRGRKREAMQLIAELAGIPGLSDALAAIRELPPPRYSEPQWNATLALLGSLKLGVAQLRTVFRENGVADFPEINELDLNPVFARPDGATAADVRIIVDFAPPKERYRPTQEDIMEFQVQLRDLIQKSGL